MYPRRNSYDSEVSSLHLNQQPSTYVPIRLLGKGAFGEAWLYRKVDDQCLVVWKEVFLQRLDDVKKQEARNEVDVLAILDHPNVIAYYNHFLDDNSLYIEMEYANGGSLYHRLGTAQTLLDEREIIWFFYQIISGLHHIHELCILHRDIKTLNIFLTKTGLVKLGDFGIAKMLENNLMAETCVGTPYYMSPEIIQGKPYSFHSDMWSTGCVLYEMLTLKRTFDATNPLRLAAEIVKGRYEDVSEQYSIALRQLLTSLLQQEPEKRPKTAELLQHPLLSEVHASICQRVTEICQMEGYRRPLSGEASRFPIVVSKSTEVYQWGAGKYQPKRIPQFENENAAVQISIGNHHAAVVTVEKEVYTWTLSQGVNKISGELGHGDQATYRSPKLVNSLIGLPLKQVACGDDFTMCSTEDGRLFTFGSDYYGCLGVGGTAGDCVLSPVEVTFFHRDGHPVHRIACGDNHCVVLTQDFEIYTWGCGEFGRLALGSEEDFPTPQKVDVKAVVPCVTRQLNYRPCDIVAGSDGTFFLAENGKVFACGNNEHNKLGFNNAALGIGRATHRLTFDIPCELYFKLVKPLSRYRIRFIAAGKTHTAVVDEFDKLYLFGSNRYGQLGTGDYKAYLGIQKVSRTLSGKMFCRVACGDGFTVACTRDKEVFSWGLASDGRLGYEFDNAKGNSVQPCQPTPKAIFGALHDVTWMTAKSWHILIIAERLLNTRVVNAKSSNIRSSPVNSPSRTPNILSNLVSQQSTAASSQSSAFEIVKNFTVEIDATVENLEDSFTPDWLKEEYHNAEIIPLDPAGQDPASSSNQLSSSHFDKEEIDEKTKSPQNLDLSVNALCLSNKCKLEKHELKAKIKELEEENAILKQNLLLLNK